MNNKYDIVIIGGGLGGLLCGAILARNGYKICILEKHFQLGGNIQTFKRNGRIFSAGMHFIGCMEPNQILYKCYKYIEIADKMKIQKMDEQCFQTIHLKDKTYTYAMGVENFTNNLIAQFPKEEKAIRTYVSKLEEIWDSINLLNLREIDTFVPFESEYLAINAYDYIASITKDETLREVLAATNGLYAGEKDKTPLHIHALINFFYIKSAFKLDEREVSLTKLLADSITDKGGEIYTKQEVVTFEYDNNDEKITSVKTVNGDTFYGDSFISNIPPQNTIKLAKEEHFRKAFVHRINALENTISPFILFISLQRNTIKNLHTDTYSFNGNSTWGIDNYDSQTWPNGYVFYTTPDLQNETYAESMTVITFMKYDEVKQWEHTTIGKRGEDYKNFKKQKAETLLQSVYQRYPEIESSIESYTAATPLTYKDYTGIPQGSMYGIIKDYKNHLISFMTPRTKIPNLFLTGQNIQMHGILGVTMCALYTCSVFIDYNTLMKDIRNA